MIGVKLDLQRKVPIKRNYVLKKTPKQHMIVRKGMTPQMQDSGVQAADFEIVDESLNHSSSQNRNQLSALGTLYKKHDSMQNIGVNSG